MRYPRSGCHFTHCNIQAATESVAYLFAAFLRYINLSTYLLKTSLTGRENRGTGNLGSSSGGERCDVRTKQTGPSVHSFVGSGVKIGEISIRSHLSFFIHRTGSKKINSYNNRLKKNNNKNLTTLAKY